MVEAQKKDREEGSQRQTTPPPHFKLLKPQGWQEMSSGKALNQMSIFLTLVFPDVTKEVAHGRLNNYLLNK